MEGHRVHQRTNSQLTPRELFSGVILTRGTQAAPRSPPGGLLGSPGPWALLKVTQVVVQRLDIGEDTHGVWLAAHHHHVLHLDEALAVGQVPGAEKPPSGHSPAPQPPHLTRTTPLFPEHL